MSGPRYNEFITAPKVRVIDDEGVPEPRMHVWMKPAVSWEPVADGLPQHDTHP